MAMSDFSSSLRGHCTSSYRKPNDVSARTTIQNRDRPWRMGPTCISCARHLRARGNSANRPPRRLVELTGRGGLPRRLRWVAGSCVVLLWPHPKEIRTQRSLSTERPRCRSVAGCGSGRKTSRRCRSPARRQTGRASSFGRSTRKCRSRRPAS